MPPQRVEPPRVECEQPVGDRTIAPTPISWDPAALADYIAYLLGIIRGERGQRDVEHECLAKLRKGGVIQ